MVNFATLSGLYENSRKVTRVLGTGQNITQLIERLKVLATNPHPHTVAELTELARALDALDSHTRVMGMTEMIKAVD